MRWSKSILNKNKNESIKWRQQTFSFSFHISKLGTRDIYICSILNYDSGRWLSITVFEKRSNNFNKRIAISNFEIFICVREIWRIFGRNWVIYGIKTDEIFKRFKIIQWAWKTTSVKSSIFWAGGCASWWIWHVTPQQSNTGY